VGSLGGGAAAFGSFHSAMVIPHFVGKSGGHIYRDSASVQTYVVTAARGNAAAASRQGAGGSLRATAVRCSSPDMRLVGCGSRMLCCARATRESPYADTIFARDLLDNRAWLPRYAATLLLAGSGSQLGRYQRSGARHMPRLTQPLRPRPRLRRSSRREGLPGHHPGNGETGQQLEEQSGVSLPAASRETPNETRAPVCAVACGARSQHAPAVVRAP